jgi:SAM-dependent methyltransferase
MTAEPASKQRIYFDDLFGFFERFLDGDTTAMTLLDFGSGEDGYVRLYRERFGRCIALDIVDYADHYCGGDIEFVRSDGLDIPLPDRSVDVIVSHSTLEHVEDIERTLEEMNRVLRTEGLIYLTIAPLYFSPSGGHLRAPGQEIERLDNWEHLDPDSPHHLSSDDAPQWIGGGAFLLNKLTTSRFLAAVGQQPWEIKSFVIKPQRKKPLPSFLRASNLNRVDLFVREFRFVGKKIFSVIDDELVMG